MLLSATNPAKCLKRIRLSQEHYEAIKLLMSYQANDQRRSEEIRKTILGFIISQSDIHYLFINEAGQKMACQKLLKKIIAEKRELVRCRSHRLLDWHYSHGGN